MSSLTAAERRKLEQLFGMGGGYVLDFTDATYCDFFRDHGVDIVARRFHINGTSKAKRMRAFWQLEADKNVGAVLEGLYEYVDASDADRSQPVEEKHRAIAARLLGRRVQSTPAISSETEFLAEEFGKINLGRLGLHQPAVDALRQRIDEIQICLQHGAHLAAVFLAGSALEGLLLNSASHAPQSFNSAKAAPKKSGKVLPFAKWKLNDFINAAAEVGSIRMDVKEYSHSLRSFRNFIHPFEQAQSGFNPDQHTARISWQVLRAAIADLTGER